MPVYSYTCPICRAKLDRIVLLTTTDDKQTCNEKITTECSNGGESTYLCQGELVKDEIAVTAKMAQQWKQSAGTS